MLDHEGQQPLGGPVPREAELPGQGLLRAQDVGGLQAGAGQDAAQLVPGEPRVVVADRADLDPRRLLGEQGEGAVEQRGTS